MNNKEISLIALIDLLKRKGINRKDIGWNPTKRKLGFAKTKKTAMAGYSISFYYFDIDENNKIIECPRGYYSFKGYTVTGFEKGLEELNG